MGSDLGNWTLMNRFYDQLSYIKSNHQLRCTVWSTQYNKRCYTKRSNVLSFYSILDLRRSQYLLHSRDYILKVTSFLIKACFGIHCLCTRFSACHMKKIKVLKKLGHLRAIHKLQNAILNQIQLPLPLCNSKELKDYYTCHFYQFITQC